MRPATIVAICLAAVAIMAVTFVNGGPVIYPDSVAYLIDGERIVHLVAPYATRAVPYGIIAWLLHGGTGWSWFALFVQAAIVAHVMWLAARVAGARLSPAGLVAMTLGLVVATPLAWHAAHLLPDIFIAAMVLAIFALGFCADRLQRFERVYLWVLIAACVSFHVTAIPIAVALALLLAAAKWRRDGAARPLWIVAPAVVAVIGTLGFNALVWHRLTLTPNSPPFLLARLIADGPARDFLRARCPDAGFELCRYLDRLPATEEGFMWHFMSDVPPESGRRIKAELGAVVGGTVTMFPLRVVGLALANGARQLVTFQSETVLTDADWAEFQGYGSKLALAARGTLQDRRLLERPHLDAINAAHAAVAVASLVMALVLLARGVRTGSREPAALLLTVLFAIAVNAFVTGPLSGVFHRFGGRVIWLLPYAVVVAWLSLHRAPALERRKQGAIV